MKRRTFLSTSTAALAIAAVPALKRTPDWIVVATFGWNHNQRAYTETALDQMATGLVGTMVMEGGDKDLWGEDGDLSLARGVVTHSKRTHDRGVAVKIDWFKANGPLTGGVLTPTGKGKIETKAPGWGWVVSYTPAFLCFHTLDSAFEGVTRL